MARHPTHHQGVTRLLVAAVLGLLVTCPNIATAYTSTPPSPAAVDNAVAHRSDMASFLRRSGPVSTPPHCGTVCSELWLQEHRPIPNQPSSKALHGELATLKRKTGVLPGIKQLAAPVVRMAGAAGAAFGAWQVGQFIGTRIYTEWVGLEFDDLGSYTLVRYDPVYAGEDLGWLHGEFVPAPEDGYLAIFQGPIGAETSIAISRNENPPCNIRRVPGMQYFREGLIAQFSGLMWKCDLSGKVEGGWTEYAHMAFAPARLTTTNTAPPNVGEYNAPNSHVVPDQATVETAVQTELESDPQRYGNVIRWLDSVAGGTSSNPLITLVDVPDCVGLQYMECAGLLEDLELVPTHTVVTGPEIDTTLPPGAVVRTVPDNGTQVETGTQVQIRRNPATMPVTIPQPQPGETAPAYVARLQSLGLVGTISYLDSTSTDPRFGPDEVVRTVPAISTVVQPGTSVTVVANPQTAPPGDPNVGAWSPPPIPELNLEPLAVSSPTDRFPFAVPQWVLGAVGGWSGAGNCPAWDFGFPGWEQFSGQETHVTLDMCLLQPGVNILRPVFLFAGLLLCMWFFMSAAMGFGGGGGND